MTKAKVCVWWQGRKASPGAPVKKYGVFSRCFAVTEINKAIKMAKDVSRRRSGGSAVVWQNDFGLSQTLLTCYGGTRCKPTIFGKKLGMGKGTLKKGWG